MSIHNRPSRAVEISAWRVRRPLGADAVARRDRGGLGASSIAVACGREYPGSVTSPPRAAGRSPELAPELVRLIRRLPKAELHLHLEGSVQPELALALARRRGVALPGVEDGLDGVRRAYARPYKTFREFVRLYVAISSCLQEPEDFCEVTVALARALAEQHVRYAEVTFTPMTHVTRGVPAEIITHGLAEGRERARALYGVQLAWVFDIVRCFADQAAPTLELALQERERGVIGLGFAGPEEPRWPYAPFAEVFAEARAEGLHALPHAGEGGGPESIRGALTVLGAERIGHGVRCLEDPELVALLRARRVPLEVCPSSNVATGVVPDLASHPLPRLLAAGLEVSLASDDPPMFSTTLTDEYLRCAAAFSWSRGQVLALAAAAVEHSFMPEAAKRALLDEQRRVAGGG